MKPRFLALFLASLTIFVMSGPLQPQPAEAAALVLHMEYAFECEPSDKECVPAPCDVAPCQCLDADCVDPCEDYTCDPCDIVPCEPCQSECDPCEIAPCDLCEDESDCNPLAGDGDECYGWAAAGTLFFGGAHPTQGSMESCDGYGSMGGSWGAENLGWGVWDLANDSGCYIETSPGNPTYSYSASITWAGSSNGAISASGSCDLFSADMHAVPDEDTLQALLD